MHEQLPVRALACRTSYMFGTWILVSFSCAAVDTLRFIGLRAGGTGRVAQCRALSILSPCLVVLEKRLLAPSQ